MTDAESLRHSVVEWARSTFGTKRTIEQFFAAALKLVDEARELAGNPLSAEEMADVQIVLWHIAGDAGVDLLDAVEAKMRVIRSRDWAHVGNGVYQHK